MYKAGWSSNIQIVSGQKIALCMYMYGINIKIQDKNLLKSIQNDLKPKHYYNYKYTSE